MDGLETKPTWWQSLPPVMKAGVMALIAAVIALLVATASWLGGLAGPGPLPSPSTTSGSASPQPSDIPSHAPTVAPSPATSPSTAVSITSVRLMTGMTDGLEIVAKEPGPAKADLGFARIEALEVRDVETRIPSYRGARVGLYGDALMPVDQVVAGRRYWIDVTGVAAGSIPVRAFGVPITLEVTAQRFSWPLPAYMEMQFAQLARAHGLADEGSTFAARLALAKKYAGILRAHGVEPIKHAVTVYPDTTFANLGWRELVLEGRIHPPCLFGPAPNLPPSVALLQAIEAALRSGALPRDSFAYPWDEGEGDAAITAQAISRSALIRKDAPSLLQRVTRRPDPAFGAGVSFIPVMNLFDGWRGLPPGWLYVSCMSNGNCQNQASAATVAPATRFPMMVIDGPESDPERFVRESEALGATGLLYFNTTQRMPTAFDPGGQYNEGGNGDGTLLYLDGGVSRRLKSFRRGLNAVAWKRAG